MSPASDPTDWLFGGVGIVTWGISSLARSLTGLALLVAACVLAAWAVADAHLLAAVVAVPAVAFGVAVLALQTRDRYTDAETPLVALLRDGLAAVTPLLAMCCLLGYAALALTVLGLGIVALFVVALVLLGPALAAVVLVPLAVHAAVRLAVAAPAVVLDGVGPLAALEQSLDTTTRVRPQLFGALAVLSAAALPIAGIDVLDSGLPPLVLAVAAGALSAVAVTVVTRVYLDTREGEAGQRLPSLRAVVRHRLR